MSAKLFDPARLPPKDSDGFLWHPDLDQFMRGRDGGAPRQEDDDWMDMDAFGAVGFEVYEYYTEDDPEYCDVDVEDERPDGDGWLLVALVAHCDGGTNALWVRAATGDSGNG
jgi:hypothetical protein